MEYLEQTTSRKNLTQRGEMSGKYSLLNEEQTFTDQRTELPGE